MSLILIAWIVAGIMYFIPTLIAIFRDHNFTGVLIINLFLGWSVIGWIISLVMACGSKSHTIVINNNNSKDKK